MSNAVLKGHASGTGTVTLETPNTNTDRTISFPDATCNMAYEDSSGNLQVNSGYGSKATAYGCRAWVNFNQQGTQAIRASGNVSSLADNGTGKTGINFTTAMPDANYAQVIGIGDYAVEFSDKHALGASGNSTKGASFTNVDLASSAGQRDYAEVNIVIFR